MSRPFLSFFLGRSSLRILAEIFLSRKLVRRDISYLREVGWVRSVVEGFPVTLDGDPLPWMNYGVISLLNERLHPGLTVFEFGSGYSTRFFASRVSRVVSVEYNHRWYEIVGAAAGQNVTLLFKPKDVDGDYCRAVVEADELFDVVVVDGRDRVNCVLQAMKRLSSRGVIILDDSDRRRYAEAFEAVRQAEFRVLSLRGLKPGSGRAHQTSIFYRDGNCLGL